MIEENYGFIHEELDIKILILYVLHKLPYVVEPDTLFDLCASDSGVGYFTYSECLEALVSNENVVETEFGYRITEKGIVNARAVGSSLPYSVRNKIDRLIEPVEARLARQSMIRAEYHTGDTGGMVSLGVSDGVGEFLSLELLVGSEEQARKIRRNFRKDAEAYYNKLLEVLSEPLN